MNPSSAADVTDQTPPAATVPSSALHEIFRAAEAKERQTTTPVLKLHVGDPYFDPPQEAADALHDALRRGDTKYTGVEGILALREALAGKLAAENGLDAPVSRIFVTPGSAQGLTALLRALAEPGAEILLPELHWPVHLQQSLLAGLRPVFYPLGPGFRPDPEAILAAAGPRTRLLLINSPANPTGVVLDARAQRVLLEGARERGWQVVSDEAYEHYVYEGEHFSMASLERDLPQHQRIVHSVYSFSKSAAMTGYRLGYVACANDRTAHAMSVVQEAGIISPSTPIQYAGLAALGARDSVAANAKLVAHNRNVLLPPLCAAGLLAELPAGGWYAVLDVSSTGLDARTFADRLLETHSVAVVPAAGFALRPRLSVAGQVLSLDVPRWARSLVRIAFCGDPDLLPLGVEKIIHFARTCEVERAHG
ncbi:pyridoxal phosphate-dependent aminotransferase [Streptomyces sp. NBC_00669]|uniref:pyridoxal phosphate-dependent aminotransferase n=1 Tax=Streptomyces sp. NBC_00669 TaxID=2976011 RepID=UPI002E30CAC6|nr:pyridoxal phosphate-dependent aminotransferase [Streptomyces sp. NBC_00669]